MAKVAPVPAAAASPAKATKKKTAAKPKKNLPSLRELIVKTVTASKERSGVSVHSLKRALAADGYDVDKNNNRVNTAIKGLVGNGTLVQVKGAGASGSFKLNKEVKATKPATKKPAAKKASAPKAKKPAAKKPVAAKTSPKKKPTAKKPAAAKAKKPAASKKIAAKSPKKATKSPKKATKPVKKTPVKKPTKAKAAKKVAPKKK